MADLSDGALARAVVAGDLDAFGTLIRRHQDALNRFAVRMLGDRDEADDVLTATFVRAHRGLSGCRDPERFGSWIRQILVNECRTALAGRARRARWFASEDAAEGLLSTAGVEGDPLMRDRIEAALARLTPELREAFLLKHMDEMNYDEMAVVTGAGVSALKMRVKRAIEQLREQLEGVRDV
jgi:RNA polymerase sigma-70 factor (ECF subfamily)